MKSKNFVIFGAIMALICLGLWWMARSKVSAPNSTVPLSLPANAPAAALDKVESAKPISVSKQIVEPLAPTVQTVSGSANGMTLSAATDAADPRADLKTVLPDFVSLIRKEGWMSAYLSYMAPARLAAIPPDAKDNLLESAARYLLTPAGQQVAAATAQQYEDLEVQTPTLNETGDEATYFIQPLPPSPAEPAGSARPITFVRIDGKWYLK